VVFKLTNAICESYNKSWMVINKCRLHAISRNKVVFNFNGTILHPCSNIIIELQMFKKASGYKPWLIKFNLDACRFIKKSYNPFATLVYNLFKDFTNINHTCPYVVSFKYINSYLFSSNIKIMSLQGDQIIEGFYLRPELLNLPLPTGEYLLAFTWVFSKQRLFITNVYFTFT
ncbi:hypothetical protein KR093_011536, partial [Drosophila rubida]